jgi:hypothetical protein
MAEAALVGIKVGANLESELEGRPVGLILAGEASLRRAVGAPVLSAAPSGGLRGSATGPLPPSPCLCHGEGECRPSHADTPFMTREYPE